MNRFFKIVSIGLFTLTLTFVACKKEKYWYTEIVLSAVDHNSIELQVENFLQRNKDNLTTGICINYTINPTIEHSVYEVKHINSSLKKVEILELYANTDYHIRSYIITKKDNIIYSEDLLVTTSSLPEPPCTVSSGVIKINGFNQSVGNLTVNTWGETYKISIMTSVGKIDFNFSEEPRSGIYNTVSSTTWLNAFEVYITGTLGGWLTCSYGGNSVNGIYVVNDNNGNIKIQFCDLVLITNQSCTEEYLISGEIHN